MFIATKLSHYKKKKTMPIINPHITDPGMRAMMGLPSDYQVETYGQDLQQGNVISALHTALAEAGVQPGGVDYKPFLQGVDLSRQYSDPIGTANAILANMQSSGQFTGLRPFTSQGELSARNAALPGHSSGSVLGDLAGTAVGSVGELLQEPGVQGILAAAGGTALAGGGAAGGSAAAGGTAAGGAYPGNAILMGMGEPISSAELTSLGFGGGGGLASGAAYGGAVAPSTAAPAGGTGLNPSLAGPQWGSSVVPAVAPPAAAASTGLASLLSSPTALGIGAGALLGGMGGSEQAGTMTVEEGLPDWLMPYVKPALDKYSTDLQNYQIDPYGVMPSAMKEFQNTISGMYLDPSTNKYLEDYFRLGSERVKGALSPSFGHMQAFGQHSGYNEALSRGLGDFATGLYGGNYAKERDRQTQMTAAAPSFIGQSSQAAFAPYQQYLQSVGSLGRKKEEPYFENPFGNILGGALVGGSLGNIWK